MKNKNKILILRTTNFYGGPEKQIHHFAQIAVRNGHDVTVASIDTNEKKPEFLKAITLDNIHTRYIRTNSAFDLDAIMLLRDYIKIQAFDIVFTHDYKSTIITFLARRGLDFRWITFSRGWTFETIKILVFYMLETLCYNFSDAIVAVSRSQEKRIRYLILPWKKTTVVHNSIDQDSINALEPVDIRKTFNIPAQSKVVVSAGRFSPEKGQKILVQSAMEILCQDQSIYFILFGDGPDFNKIKTLLRDCKYKNHIILPGHRSDVLNCIKGGVDLVINPSLSEGLPNIVLESMALGIPVIATEVGGVPELIVHGINGILVEKNSVSDLTENIKKLINDRKTCQILSENALETIRTDFNFESQYRQIEQLLQN